MAKSMKVMKVMKTKATKKPKVAKGKKAMKGSKGALGGGKGSKHAKRLLLVMDSVPCYELFIQAAADPVTVVPVKYNEWGLADLNKAIKQRCGAPKHQFASIGIVDHGKPGAFQLLKKVDAKYGDVDGIDLEDLTKNAELKTFLKNLAKYVERPRSLGKWQTDNKCRIDLLACSVAASDEGKKLIDNLEQLTKVNWTASMDKTGGSAKGNNWVMETEKKLGSIAPCYFNVQKLKKWEGELDMQVKVGRHGNLRIKPDGGGTVVVPGMAPVVHYVAARPVIHCGGVIRL